VPHKRPAHEYAVTEWSHKKWKKPQKFINGRQGVVAKCRTRGLCMSVLSLNGPLKNGRSHNNSLMDGKAWWPGAAQEACA